MNISYFVRHACGIDFNSLVYWSDLEPQHNSGPQSPSKLSEIQQQNVTDCIHAVVERVMYDNKERPQKKKPGIEFNDM